MSAFFVILFKWICKPSSVLYDHLSTNNVTVIPQRYFNKPILRNSIKPICQSCVGWGLHCLPRYRRSGGLLPRLFTLTPK